MLNFKQSKYFIIPVKKFLWIADYLYDKGQAEDKNW